jgi:hypothetical protein
MYRVLLLSAMALVLVAPIARAAHRSREAKPYDSATVTATRHVKMWKSRSFSEAVASKGLYLHVYVGGIDLAEARLEGGCAVLDYGEAGVVVLAHQTNCETNGESRLIVRYASLGARAHQPVRLALTHSP